MPRSMPGNLRSRLGHKNVFSVQAIRMSFHSVTHPVMKGRRYNQICFIFRVLVAKMDFHMKEKNSMESKLCFDVQLTVVPFIISIIPRFQILACLSSGKCYATSEIESLLEQMFAEEETVFLFFSDKSEGRSTELCFYCFGL